MTTSDFDEAIRLDPKFAAAHAQRGTVYIKNGEYDKAWKDYEKAIRGGRQR